MRIIHIYENARRYYVLYMVSNKVSQFGRRVALNRNSGSLLVWPSSSCSWTLGQCMILLKTSQSCSCWKLLICPQGLKLPHAQHGSKMFKYHYALVMFLLGSHIQENRTTYNFQTTLKTQIWPSIDLGWRHYEWPCGPHLMKRNSDSNQRHPIPSIMIL